MMAKEYDGWEDLEEYEVESIESPSPREEGADMANEDDENEDLEEEEDLEESPFLRLRKENLRVFNKVYNETFSQVLAHNKELREEKERKQAQKREKMRATRLRRQLEKSQQPIRRSLRLNASKRKGSEIYSYNDEEFGEGQSNLLYVSFPFCKRKPKPLGKKGMYKVTGSSHIKKKRSDRELEAMEWSMVLQNPPNHFKGFSKSEAAKSSKRISYLQRMIKLLRTPRANQINPKDITQHMINNIYYRSTGKKQDSVDRTSCHQCRQKTTDTKSICRWPICSLKKAAYCGFCLRQRYGEDVKDVLKDPGWMCPKCRGCCNCSICRTKIGLPPTGSLASSVAGTIGCTFLNIPIIGPFLNPSGKRNKNV